MTRTKVSSDFLPLRFFNWPVFLLVFPSLVSAALSQQIHEAESAELANGAQVENCDTCPGGWQVKNVGGNRNGTVVFKHISVPQEGLYPMAVSYLLSDDRSLVITVNRKVRQEVIFHRTAVKTALSSQTVLVPLQAGENTIAFDNVYESGPDLDCIVISNAPVKSFKISGEVKSAGLRPLPEVELTLSGDYEATTMTDANGHYEFCNLPSGGYYVTPASAQMIFFPGEDFCVSSGTNLVARNFTAKKLITRPDNPAVMELGKWRVEYDLTNGVADLYFDGKLVIARAFAAARMPETVSSTDFKTHTVSSSRISDGFGNGVAFVVESAGGDEKMTQTFWLYRNEDFFLTDVKISRPQPLSANFMAPLISHTPVNFLSAGDNRTLMVPFDNDKWIRYCASPFGETVVSHEVSAFYNNADREGLVIGSVEHNLWKTGVISTTTSNSIKCLEVFGGLASARTRDILPHGKVTGTTIKSPKIFVGVFSDWRNGFEIFARANTTVTPARAWTSGVPFGWNSWGKLQRKLTFEKAVQVSDFIARELQLNHFENNGVVYIGLDSGWSRLSDAQLKAFVDHCHTNGQEAGIYFTPFASWRQPDDAMVDGTSFKNRDLYLYANGQKQLLDGGVALDPTHPGTQQHIQFIAAKFKQAGFKYVKLDFLTHGSLEADRHFDPQVTTGIQGYNAGMKIVRQALGEDVYLNEAISPLFPAQYAQSRRIACDTFGDIDKTEYMLNALTYGWWLGQVYDYNDPDHVVLDGYQEGENRARVISAAITGLFLSGDDFSDSGSVVGKERAKKYLTNKDINALVKIGVSFRPAAGSSGISAAKLFVLDAGVDRYLAAFNYSDAPTNIQVELRLLGLPVGASYQAKELFSGTLLNVSNIFKIFIKPADAVLYKVTKEEGKRN